MVLAVKLKVCPALTGLLLPAVGAETTGTVIITISVAVHPPAFVAVTE
jgi:hypothetical protein